MAMHHRTVGELMNRDVVQVGPETLFKDLVRILAENAVGALPVVDAAGCPIGVVSEADLLRKASDQSDPYGRMPLPDAQAWEHAESEGIRADELMSAPAVCAYPEWTVVEAARLMAVRKIKRLPVVDETGRLQGIISRSDLLRVFLRRDDAIREEIDRDLLQQTLGLAPSQVTVDVREGQVALGGNVETKSLVSIIVRLCRGVDGVVSVSQHIAYTRDDTHNSAVSS